MAATNIAQEITRLTTAKADLKTAIEGKCVTVPSTTKLDGYASLVDQIQQGGAEEAPENDVNFYDYDGFRVASYTIAEAKALTALPTPPQHNGLTFQEWNWSLADIQAYNRRYINIGANYVTSDGKTHMEIIVESGQMFGLQIKGDAGKTLYIDWGDSTIETKTTDGYHRTYQHNYTTGGDYTILVYSEETTPFWGCIFSSLSGVEMCNHSLRAIYFGRDVKSEYIQLSCVNLIITMPSHFTSLYITTASAPCLALRSGTYASTNQLYAIDARVCFPKQVVDLSARRLFSGCFCKRVVFPEYTASTMMKNFNAFYTATAFSLPLSAQFSENLNFQNCQCLREMDIVDGWTPNVSINFNASRMWSAESMVDFFSKLGTTQTAITLTFGAANLNRLTADQKAIATGKGYTLA